VRLRALAVVVAVTALLAPVAACGKSGQAKTTLTVLAAASLTNAFGEMKAAYAKDHPDVTLRFSFAGSQELAAQVRSGAPADVIATADEKTMTGLSKYVVDPEPFVTNRLTIVVGKGNPKHIETLADLARGDVKVVLAGPTVPAGRYARQILARAKVNVRPKSEPTDVRQVLTPVRLGEADAGIVYVTDVKDAGGSQLQAVSIPAKQNLVAAYPVAAIKDSEHAAAAKAFAAWLRTPAATAILTEHGFGTPPK
jgi:molybdate transport system substrate-binding protein